MVNEKRITDNFLKYVQIDSPTKEEREFAEFLMKKMESLGFEVTMDDAGDKIGCNAGNLICKLKGTTDGEPILFSSHMDTVYPSRGIKPHIKDGVIYSDGTTILASDDKAGVAAIIEGIETVLENKLPHPDIEVSFSVYEEGGLFGVKNIDPSQFRSKTCFVLDSDGSPGEIVIGGPAQNSLFIEFKGRASHAGAAPEDGISAIRMAAEAINNMKLSQVDKETTANVGVISGGEATNIITESVKMEAEARSLDNEKLENQTNHMIKCCEEAAKRFGGSVDIKVENVYSAFNIDEDAQIVKVAKEACNNLGFEPYTVLSGGGSDTNVWNSYGINSINLGVGIKKPHTLTEHISIKDLSNSARLVVELIGLFA